MLIHRVEIPLRVLADKAIKAAVIASPNCKFELEDIRIDQNKSNLIIDIKQVDLLKEAQ